ncbi:hypothetical protein KC340_g11189 [Hortaea werneckii]|nr:hypothetical protein KC342_g11404 [Hortaea werneckii]KAI7084194.1 hypothetical protein KC339_g13015 [Hortaea werneckii]KAI7229329.1 hypothetical protein KC365_g8070 [Hortaea werneckii]KAI7307980.1 hypothetical protein KC340_g11189 [Hortaea werneckii]KAI7393818.1 hypothetical protein KC328_g6412 [Hortaea werneckii]
MEETDPTTSMLRKIELSTMKKVAMTTDETEAYGKFNNQLASPLFSKLPRELRDLIWAYSTAPYEDPDGKFNKTAYYYRPGHTARLKSDTALLLTCRRVWLEANAMPMLQAEHSFYFHRAAPDARDPAWMSRLTDKNRRDFGHLHMFAQMFAIERLTDTVGQVRQFFLSEAPKPNDFQPRMMHVTIRHTDWWFWENEEPLRLSCEWVQALLDSPDLRNTEVIKLELETLDYKADQLKPILEQIKQLQSLEAETHLIDGKPAKSQFVVDRDPEVYSWEGPANINDQKFEPYEGRNILKYHVVTLTWRLCFPEFPSGVVPRLRLRPRIGLPYSALQDVPEMAEIAPAVQGPFCRLPGYIRKHAGSVPMTRKRKATEDAHDERMILRWRTANQHAQWLEASRARMMEGIRKRQFDASMVQRSVDKTELRWKGENSLLKLGEDIAPAPLRAGPR